MQTHINALRLGGIIKCPEDRGIPAYMGKVESFDRKAVNLNINGVKYIWVHVRDAEGHAAVWPSHRLGFYI